MKVALAGNPNSGKTTLFNALTGSNQHAGNWPGVTVEKKTGRLKADKSIEITDLPGIYSLSPYTLEEVVARNYIIDEQPDVILNIVDGTNLERNLYLTTQLLEMGIPVIVAINMMDIVHKRNEILNTDALAEKLSCPVCEISALKNKGIKELVKLIKNVPENVVIEAPKFSKDIEDAIEEIIALMFDVGEGPFRSYSSKKQSVDETLIDEIPYNMHRYYAIKLLEKDKNIAKRLKQPINISKIIERIEKKFDDDTESIIINERYMWISSIMHDVRQTSFEAGETTSDKIDKVVTNRILAIPIFVVIMFLVYFISVTTIGGFATDWANDGVFGDGWFLGPGSDEYEQVSEDYDAALQSVTSYEQAALDAGLDPASQDFIDQANDIELVATYEDFDDETGINEIIEVNSQDYEDALDIVSPDTQDQQIITAYQSRAIEEGMDPLEDDFLAIAEEQGLVATYETTADDGTTEIADITTLDYEDALEASAPDPADFGIWVPGIPVLLGDFLTNINCVDWLQNLILDGIVGGVGAVLGFIPQLLVLFILLAFLEACGYMSRVAFILDRVFRRFGLSGKSFIPILIGTGCGVPGIMASRTIENQNDRRMTVMTTTFIPCSAKLPIIALFASAIFGGVWWVAPSAYFLGIAAILCSGVILKKTRFFAGEASPFVMELPAYHWPTVMTLLRSMWERAWSFIKKAGTIILLACILVWFISSYGFVDGVFVAVENQNDSILAVLGSLVCWIFNPLGWGDWQATSAAVTGLIAKENVVGTLGILYDGGLGWYTNLQLSYTTVAAYSFMAFNLLCAPCFAAMGAIRREMNNTKWFWAAIGYECGLAYCVSLCIYQIAGLIVGIVSFNFWTIVAFALVVVFVYLLLRPQPKHNVVLKSSRSVDAV